MDYLMGVASRLALFHALVLWHEAPQSDDAGQIPAQLGPPHTLSQALSQEATRLSSPRIGGNRAFKDVQLLG